MTEKWIFDPDNIPLIINLLVVGLLVLGLILGHLNHWWGRR